MPNIVNSTFFINDLFIPNAQDVQSIGIDTPSSISDVTDCITVVEKFVLQNALGLTIYNELQTALADIDDADQKWKDLVNGIEYDGKVWEGLNNPKTLIAYAVYYNFLNNNSEYYTTWGVVKPEAVNSTNITPFYKLTSAFNMFLTKYQRGAYSCHDYYSGLGWDFVDWYGSDKSINVSLYEYMRDKAELYVWTPEDFRYYEHVNTFGI